MEERNYAKNENRESNIVFTKSVAAGKRVYYLDVKRSGKGDLFMVITESKKVFDGDSSQPFHFEKHKIFLYKEDFDKFLTAFDEVLHYVKENNEIDLSAIEAIKDTFDPDLEDTIHFNLDF
ncbi:MAG: PUR family DNA/RNA-binding protein [Dysgonamonadaceae bacterium]|jgi:hypothetical protein|nr:PUR family DNA/RNA-binding protein [Dysgonamonadaceae bacterium]